MKVRLFTLAVSIVSLIFSTAIIVILLTCNLNAASLQPSETRQDWQDLEVITLDSQGDPAKTVYYSYDQLLTLPTITVKPSAIRTRTPRLPIPESISAIFWRHSARTPQLM
jgi:hypothetical protein